MKLIKYLIKSLMIAFLAHVTTATASDIVVTFKNQHCSAIVAQQAYRCSIGKNGATPIGKFALRQIMVRQDKIIKSNLRYVSLPIVSIKAEDGWCEDPKNKDYNRLININNFDNSIKHERLHRDDDLYNILIVTDKGSAVFIHVATPDYAATAGCIGFAEHDLMKILTKLDENSKLIVHNALSNN